MRALAALLFVLFAAAPALAAGSPETQLQYVDVGPVALPVIQQGKLRNYVFVTVRLHLNAQADPETWRDKEPYFRDALVRAGHRTPFVIPGDWMKLDQAALKRSMWAEAIRIAGRNIFTSIEVIRAIPQRWAVPTPG
jgi:hypothetical protein